MNKKIWKLIKWLFKPKKILYYIVTIIILVVATKVYLWNEERIIVNNSIKACISLNDANVDKFAEKTGLTAANIYYGEPEIEVSRNLRVLNFKNYRVGNSMNEFTKFVCSYNLATEKARDTTPALSDSDVAANS